MSGAPVSAEGFVAVAMATASLMLASRKLRSANLPMTTRIWVALAWLGVFLLAGVLAARFG